LIGPICRAVDLEERRVALRERIRADLPISEDGSIRLTARAGAARDLSAQRTGID
jgi:hypothetical protein